jgi:hypothetical protein
VNLISEKESRKQVYFKEENIGGNGPQMEKMIKILKKAIKIQQKRIKL